MTDSEKVKKLLTVLKIAQEKGFIPQFGKDGLEYIDNVLNKPQEETVTKDLDKAADEYASKASQAYKGVYCEYSNDQIAFKAGAKWQKEQMMKDAVYGLVCGHDKETPAWIDLNLLNKPNVKVGKEVKLIIINEE